MANDRQSPTRGEEHPHAPRNGGSSNQQRGAAAPASSLPATEFTAKYTSITAEIVEVVRKVQCPTATDVELHYFFGVCQKQKLDPLTNQIWLVKRRQKVQDSWGNEQTIEVARPQVGIDGYRVIAERTGEYEGQGKMLWCGDDGKWVDVWLHEHPPRAAMATVYRHGFREPLCAVALWDEYVPGFMKNGVFLPMAKWRQSPASQLGKCAEALALRKAFPNDLSGIYTDTEMERTDSTEAHGFTAPAAPSKTIDVQATVADAATASVDAKNEQKATAALESTEMKAKADADLAALFAELEMCTKRQQLVKAQQKHLGDYLKTPNDPFSKEVLDRARPVYVEHSARVKELERQAVQP